MHPPRCRSHMAPVTGQRCKVAPTPRDAAAGVARLAKTAGGGEPKRNFSNASIRCHSYSRSFGWNRFTDQFLPDGPNKSGPDRDGLALLRMLQRTMNCLNGIKRVPIPCEQSISPDRGAVLGVPVTI